MAKAFIEVFEKRGGNSHNEKFISRENRFKNGKGKTSL